MYKRQVLRHLDLCHAERYHQAFSAKVKFVYIAVPDQIHRLQQIKGIPVYGYSHRIVQRIVVDNIGTDNLKQRNFTSGFHNGFSTIRVLDLFPGIIEIDIFNEICTVIPFSVYRNCLLYTSRCV